MYVITAFPSKDRGTLDPCSYLLTTETTTRNSFLSILGRVFVPVNLVQSGVILSREIDPMFGFQFSTYLGFSQHRHQERSQSATSTIHRNACLPGGLYNKSVFLGGA